MELIIKAIENDELEAEVCIWYDESEGVIGCTIFW